MQNNTFSGDSLRQKIIVLEQIGSTNDYLKSQLSNFKPLPEWTAIMARHQTHGRGQRGNVWTVPPNKNITVSTLLYPKFLSLQDHFLLNMLISLGIIDWLKSLKIDAEIKWPNDILLNGKKIAGILIENSSTSKAINHAIIGIGINVNQQEFPAEIKATASSILKETGNEIHDLVKACEDLLQSIQNKYDAFKSEKITQEELLNLYNKLLFQRDIPAIYTSNDIQFEGIIRKVDRNGLINIESASELKSYQFKEVVFHLQKIDYTRKKNN